MSDTPQPPARRAGKEKAAWGLPAKAESRWAPRIAIVAALVLYLRLPGKYTIGPIWLVPALELAILAALFAAGPLGMERWQRAWAILLVAILNAANFASLILLVRELAYHGNKIAGPELLNSSINIWVTNVIIFALWYWELDRGGPSARLDAEHEEPDFLFPQMVTPGCALPEWHPRFIDYLYVAFTNATAFSPTDTMPLTPWAKGLMLVQSTVSILTVTLVAARAVNILS